MFPSVPSTASGLRTPVGPQGARIHAYDVAALDDCLTARGYARVPARPPN
jgi:hypothetical protein